MNRGMQQSPFARAAGLTWAAGQRVGQGRAPGLMALGTARRVADALEMTIDEFEVPPLTRINAEAPLGLHA